MAATTADPVILYDAAVSSYCQKIRIALREKGISFKIVVPEAIKTGRSDPDFQGLNPRLEVPTLVDGDVKVFDSTIIMEYLEDKWPGKTVILICPYSLDYEMTDELSFASSMTK